MTDWRTQLEADGFALLCGVLSPAGVAAAVAEWDAVSSANACRVRLSSGWNGTVRPGSRNEAAPPASARSTNKCEPSGTTTVLVAMPMAGRVIGGRRV